MKVKFSAIILVSALYLANAGSTYGCPPVAVLQADPPSVHLGDSVTLDGLSSYGSFGRYLIKFEWDYDYNGATFTPDYNETPPGDKKAEHTYDTNGPHTAALRVTDNSELTDIATCTVNVVTGVRNLTQDKWYGRIQSAINEANNSDTIEVNVGTYKENINFLDKKIFLQSTEPNNWLVVGATIIDANDNNFATVTFNNSGNYDAVLAGFKISGGLRGIDCNGYLSPIIRNCIIAQNGQKSNLGGGIYNCNYAGPRINNCFIVGNEANYGAGIYNDNSSPTIRNCVISKNTAVYNGGGLYDNSVDCYYPTLWNCTIINNTARYGGGMYSPEYSSAHINNCIFWYNSASEQGDEIYNNGSVPSFIIHCDISGSGGSDESVSIDSPPIFKPSRNIDEGLVAHWSFDENSGTTAHDSVGANHGTVYGAAWTTGRIGGALGFNGTNDYVEMGDTVKNYLGTNYTVSAWIKTDTLSSSHTVAAYRDSEPGCSPFLFQLDQAYSDIQFMARDDFGHLVTATYSNALTTGNWYHVAGVREGNILNVYVNGVSGTPGSGTLTGAISSDNLKIGALLCHGSPVSWFFDGVIDDVRIYDKALSAEEIRQLYQDGFVGKYHLSHNSPCRNAGENDDPSYTGKTDIDNEIRVREGHIDIGADEYVTTEFPYICSFEDYQGFMDPVSFWPYGGTGDWVVKSGYSAGIEAASYFLTDGNSQPYQYVAIPSFSPYSTNFSREFVSKETDNHNHYVRISCIPSPGSYINIRKDDVNIASVLFGADDKIYVLNDGNYNDSGIAYQSVADKCRGFLTASLMPTDPNYSYENTWIELKFIFDWKNGHYDVYWQHVDNPNGSSIKTGASFCSQYSTFSEISFQTGDSGTDFELNRISISDEPGPGGFGPDKDIWVTSPVADWKEPLEGAYDITGSLWYDKLGRYEIKICPTSEDPCGIFETVVSGTKLKSDHWLLVHEGTNVVADDVLGYLSTAKFFNGDYYMRIFLYDDLNQLINPLVVDGNSDAWKTGCITKTVHYNNGYDHNDVIAEYPIIGKLKGGQSYHFEEKPDVTINWPGSFPFEFRRIYDSSLRKQPFPLFFGWTHNHNIRILESTKSDFEINDQDRPDADAQGLGIGRLYLLMPLGGRAFEGCVDENDPTTVIYEPLDNEPDYIKRTSTINGGTFDVNYTYYGPDGMKYTFNKTGNTLPYPPPQDEGAVGWMVYVGIDRQEDRFGNALVYQWDAQELSEIQSEVKKADGGTLQGAKIILDRGTLDGWPNGPVLYNRISVRDGSNLIGCYQYSVAFGYCEYEWPNDDFGYYKSFIAVYKVKDANGNPLNEEKAYYHKYYGDAGFILDRAPDFYGRYDYYDNLNYMPFRVMFYFGDDGLLQKKLICVSHPVGAIHYYLERYSDNYDEQGNLISTTEFYVLDEYDEYRYKTSRTIRNAKGAVLRQEYLVYPVSAAFWGSNNPHYMYSVVGGGAICDGEYLYEDSRFPLKPTTMFEHFDDDGTPITTYDRHSRMTKIAYDGRGNLVQKRVYADSNNFVLTEYDYHPKYNFPIRQTTWQEYCTEDGNEIVRPEESRNKKIEQLWIYGNAYGTEDSNGAYLARQKTLLASYGNSNPYDDDWAVTNYTYYPNGRLKTVDSPRTPGIGSYYLCDDKGLITKVWEGVPTGSEPNTNTTPQKRYFYDGLGRVELVGNYLGQVQLYTYDNIGHITSVKTFEDSTAMSGDFVPGSYSGNWGFVKLQLFTEYDRYDNCLKEQLETGGEFYHDYWHNKKHLMDAHTWNILPVGNGTILTLVYPYPYPDTQPSEIYLRGAGHGLSLGWDELSMTDFYYDSMDRVSRKVTGCGSYHGETFLYKVENYTHYSNGRIKNEKVYNVSSPYPYVTYEWTLEKDVNYFYDGLDRLIKKVEDPNPADGLCITTQYGYDSAGNNTYIVDPNGSIIFTDFDQANRKVREYYPKPVVYGSTDVDVNSSKADVKKKRETEYFKDNKVASVTSYDRNGVAVLAKTEFSYDGRNRIDDVNQYIQSGDGPAVTTYEYADAGQELFTDSQGEKYHIKVTDAEGQITYIALDIDGRTKRTLYPSGHYENIEDCLTYYWDGYQNHKGDKNYGHWDVNTNEIRRATGQLGGSSQTVIYKRGEWGDVNAISYPDGGYLEFDYYMCGFKDYRKIWRVRDHRIAADKPSLPNDTPQYEYEYDYRTGNLEEFIVSKNPAPGNPEDTTIEYVIDYNNLVAWPGRKKDITVTRPDPQNPENDELLYSVSYKYDRAGRLKEVDDPCVLDVNIASMQYDENGNRSNLTYYLDGTTTGDTVSIDYTYNACACQCDNQLVAFSTSGVTGLNFSFDATAAGNIDGLGRLHNCTETLTKVGGGQVSHTCTYNYDMLSRLTYAKITDVAPKPYIEYTNTYDKAGNLTEYVYNEGSGDVNKSYAFNGELVTGYSDASKTVTWDVNGRQASQLNAVPSDYSLVYDWEGRLRKGQLGSANSRIEAKYIPNGGARVTKKKIWDGNTVYNHKYIVDVSGRVPAVLLVLDANNNDAIVKTYIHADNQVLAQYDGANRYFYLHDRLGSVRQVIDQSGTVVNCYTYDPWGLPAGNETQETISNLYRFAGYVWDSEISQYYCFRRQYDPVLARFTSRDPVEGSYEEPMTLHKYLYCNNDAINRKDPTGESALELAEELTTGMSAYYVGLDVGLSIAGGDPLAMLDVAVGINAARESMFGSYKASNYNHGLINIVVPEDLWDRVEWECPATDGAYRHCVSACRLNEITGNPAITMIGALWYGNDWPSSGWGINNLSDVVADIAGIAVSYTTTAGAGCRSSCKSVSKAMSAMLCH